MTTPYDASRSQHATGPASEERDHALQLERDGLLSTSQALDALGQAERRALSPAVRARLTAATLPAPSEPTLHPARIGPRHLPSPRRRFIIPTALAAVLLVALSAALLIRGVQQPHTIVSTDPVPTSVALDEELALLLTPDGWDASLTELTTTAARLDESIGGGIDWSENAL